MRNPVHLRTRTRLCLLWTPSLCLGEPIDTLTAAIRGGVDLVQWRVKQPGPEDRRLLELGAALCSAAGVPLIINDDPRLAADLGAAGAHIGQDDLPIAAARELLQPDQWLGVSTHSVPQVTTAIAAGADYLGFGPCFATTTKGYGRAQPGGHLRAVLATATVPVFAIGGITASRVCALRTEGAHRVAVSAAILATEDPERAARTLRAALDQSTSIASPKL